MSSLHDEDFSFENVASNSVPTFVTSNGSLESIGVIESGSCDNKLPVGDQEQAERDTQNSLLTIENRKLEETAINKINQILITHSEIYEDIKRCSGITSDVNTIEQKLTLLLCQLDDVNTNGNEGITLFRGNEIKKIKESIKELHLKSKLLSDGTLQINEHVSEVKRETEENQQVNSEIPPPLLQGIANEENPQQISGEEDETTRAKRDSAGENNEEPATPVTQQNGVSEPKKEVHVNGPTAEQQNEEIPDPEAMSDALMSQYEPLHPVQLLRKVDSHFELDEEAVKRVLCAERVRNRKLVVVSVVGAYRRGKSFLLNFMLRYLRANGKDDWMRPQDRGRLEGFSWRGGSERDTTGVLMWPEAFLVGEDLAVVLLDTQGTFDSATTLQENAFIFALSTLLSSVQIFNLSERIQMDDLSNLQYFTEIGRMIQEECGTKAFQNLIFLIRDWRYPREHFFGKSGGDGVLSKWLQTAEGSATRPQAEMIRMCFNDILCFLMPHPGDVVANDPDYQGTLEAMKPEFVQYINQFITLVLAPQNLVAKTVGQQVILAGDFVQHMRFCVEQLRNPDLQAKTFFESMSETAHKKAVRDVTMAYSRKFWAEMLKCDDIHVLHEVLQQRALQMYDSMKKFGSKSTSDQFKITLQEDLRDAYYRLSADYKRICTEQAETIRLTAEAAVAKYHATIAALCESAEPAATLQETHNVASQEAVALLQNLSNEANTSKVQSAVIELEKRLQSTFELLGPIYKRLRLYERQVAEANTERELVSAVNRALSSYRAVMEAQCAGDRVVEDLLSVHEAARGSAAEVMSGRVAKYEPEISQPYVTKLTKIIEDRYATYQVQNDRLRACQQTSMQFSLSKSHHDAVERYHKQMSTGGTRSSAEFEAAHLAAKEAALKLFAVHDGKFAPQEYESYLENAKSEFQDIYKILKEANDAAGKKERDVELQKVHLSAMKQYGREMAALFANNRHVAALEESHAAAKKRVCKFYEAFDRETEEYERWTRETDEAIDTEFSDLKKKNEDLRIIAENKILVDGLTECRNFYQKSMEEKCTNLKSNSGIDNVHNVYFLKALNMFEEKNNDLKHTDTYRKYYQKLQMDIQNCKTKFEKYMSKLERARTNQLRESVKFAVSLYRKAMQGFIPNAAETWLPKLLEVHEKHRKAAHDAMMAKYRRIKGVTSEHENQINLEFQNETETLWKKFEELNNAYGEKHRTLTDNTVKSAYREALLKYQAEIKSSVHAVDGVKFGKLHEIWHDQCIETFLKTTERFKGEVRDEYLIKLKQDIQAQFETFEEERSKHLRKLRQEETNTESLALGIDLGTTYICAAVYRGDKVEIIENIGNRTMPSAVYFDEDNQKKFGESAIYLGYKDSKNCVSEVKRIIGRKFNDPVVQSVIKQWDFKVEEEKGEPVIVLTKGDKKRWRPEEVSALLLGEVKRLAEACLGAEVHDAVVTIPAYFNEPQRRATKEACAQAGLNVLRMFNEPTAAAIAYGLQNKSFSPRQILVFDFGGGTCDVSILLVHGDKFDVQASSGDNELGGEDIDNLVTNYLVEKFEKDHDTKLANFDYRRLRHQCEKVKRNLSDETEYFLQIDKFSDKNILFQYKIERNEFENVNDALFPRILIPVAKCLEEANLEKDKIDEIVLAGGSSKIPKVRELLSSFFDGKILNSSINADEAIAYGAAIQAAILTNKYDGGIKISDITPFSLGTDVINDRMSIIIPKNTTISCSRTQRFVTALNDQTSMTVEVYQGENTENKKANTLLGEFVLSGLRAAPAGEVSADVTLALDLNGILQVTAREVGNTDNTKSIKIEKIFM